MNDVVVKEENALAVIDYGADAMQFKNDFSQEDLALPFLTILQALSPQLDAGDPKYIEEAKAGMFYNTVTKQLYNGQTGVSLIPIKFSKSMIEWVTRENGGGFVAQHEWSDKLAASTRKDEKGRDILENGNQLVRTATFICSMADAFDPVIVTFTSTQFKKSKNWASLISRLTSPDGKTPLAALPFAGVYRFTTVRESNEKGNWSGFQIVQQGYTADLPNGPEIYAKCRELKKALDSGAAKVDMAASTAADGDEVPF